eukprot:s942_g10.t1
MIGGYDNNNRRDQQLVDLANQLRLKIQDVVMNAGHNCQIFHLEPPGNTDQERAEAAAQLVAIRVQRGGHFANTYPEQIQRSRESALQLRKELQEYNVNVRAFHYNSSNGNYVEFELKEGASYAF